MTISLGDISIRYVRLLLDTAKRLELHLEPVLEPFQFSDSQLQQPAARISIPKFMRLGYELIAASNHPQLGISAGQLAKPSLMSLTGFMAECAPSLGQALKDIAEFEALNSKNARGRSRFYREDNTGVSEFYSISPYNEFNLFIVDMALSVQFSLLNEVAGRVVEPKLVQIEFPEPPYKEAYQQFFPCPVKFNQPRNALVFPWIDLQAPPRQANPATYAECRALCTAQLQQTEQSLSFLERVMNEISPLLHTTDLSLQQVALHMEIAPWTLRRKLADEGTTFTQLLDDTRRHLALIYMRDAQYSLGEVAYMLGFAYPNAFQRAFKRWQGISPGAYRKQLQSNE